MKHKPLTLIEGNSEINNGFYEKVNQIIEEERKKNSAVQMMRSDTGDELKYTS